MTTGSESEFALHYVETWDGLYAPIAVRTPAGDGPFPMVLLGHGNGGRGVEWLREHAANRGYFLDALVDAGYACAWTRYRAEVEQGYAQAAPLERGWAAGGPVFNRLPLEYEDTIAIADYVKQLDFVDEDRVAWVGVSHGGEMLLKMAAEYHGFACGVACEPAAHEFFGLSGGQVREVKQAAAARAPSAMTDADVAAVRELMRRDLVQARVAPIATPILVMGRPADDLNALFRATYDVLAEAGKDVEWTSYEHDLHGYIYPQRGDDGAYRVDSVQHAAIAEVIAYLNRYLQPSGLRE